MIKDDVVLLHQERTPGKFDIFQRGGRDGDSRGSRGICQGG